MKSIYEAQSVGRRKSAVARAYLKQGEGSIEVNGKPYEVYFGRAVLQMIVRQPLEVVNLLDKFHIKINVAGGGVAGQAAACRHAIARALEKVDPALRPPMKAEGLMTRDAREVERKKYGKHKARRRPQFSKR